MQQKMRQNLFLVALRTLFPRDGRTGGEGELLATACEDKAEILYATIDINRSENIRRIWPYLRDRRIDAYNDLLLRYRDKE